MEGRTAELNCMDSRHRTLLNSLDHGLAVLDRDGVVTVWNRAAERIWGLRAEQVVNRQFFGLSLGDMTQQAQEALDRVVAGSEAAEITGVLLTSLGTVQHGTLRFVPLRTIMGEVTGAVVIMATDVAATRGKS
jgi:two-component system, chemotaxis family, CheB/CheR fusion protein